MGRTNTISKINVLDKFTAPLRRSGGITQDNTLRSTSLVVTRREGSIHMTCPRIKAEGEGGKERKGRLGDSCLNYDEGGMLVSASRALTGERKAPVTRHKIEFRIMFTGWSDVLERRARTIAPYSILLGIRPMLTTISMEKTIFTPCCDSYSSQQEHQHSFARLTYMSDVLLPFESFIKMHPKETNCRIALKDNPLKMKD